MKKVLIISPYFPPTNAADMQRIRMSLPYFKKFGWEAEVVTVDPLYSDLNKDELLQYNVPENIIIHLVKAFPKKWTSKFGLGSIALRSIWYFRKKVNGLIKNNSFDLIYFSTTQFPVCILGAYWKRRFGIPYVIDMQDPWHSEYYKDKPKEQRPTKYWFSYRLNKWLEPLAINTVSGLISVSEAYILDLKNRYPKIKKIPTSVIPFGVWEKDFEIVETNKQSLIIPIKTKDNAINLVYVGRGGEDLYKALEILFRGFKMGLTTDSKKFDKLLFHFIGTSYAPPGTGKETILPLANKLGVSMYVREQTTRLSYFESLRTLQEADILIIPGSDDQKYTASKIFPYILIQKPLLGIFSKSSSTYQIVNECNAGRMIDMNDDQAENKVFNFLNENLQGQYKMPELNSTKFMDYSALRMTDKQCDLFNSIM